jgi:hypothetical protein
MDKCPSIKTMGTRCPLSKKREGIKIAHVFLQVPKESESFPKSISRIRISHLIYTYPPYSIHMHILI